MDSVVATHEAGDGLVDARFRVGGRVFHYADVQAAEKLATQPPDFGLKIRVGGEQLLRGRVDALAFVGKPKSNPAALAQAHAQAGFERRHLGAKRRGADVEFRLGRGETPTLNHRAKHPKLVCINVIELRCSLRHGSTLLSILMK